MEFLKRLFEYSKPKKIRIEEFDFNDKSFGEDLLKYFQKFLSKNMNYPVKMGWIKKDDSLPLVTITKSMDEVQKLYENKIVSFSFDIWCDNKKTRDLITKDMINLIKSVNFGSNFSVEMNNEPLTIKINVGIKEEPKAENKIIIDNPQILTFEEKKGIYRCHFSLTMHLKIDVNKKELKSLKEYDEKGKYFEKLVLGESSFGGEFLESKNNYILFKPSISRNTLALIKDNKVLWKNNFDNLVSFDFARDSSYCVAVAQLTENEMSSGYKSGGHIYIITKKGKIKDVKIPCDGLSCSISPNIKHFGITTMGPEWGVYYFNSQGKLLWKKKFDKRVGGIELTNIRIILYDKMHKETRKKIVELDKNGEIQKN